MPEKICGFFNEHRWLSNFYPSPILYKDWIWPTVEHAYQASKTTSRALRYTIRKQTTPGRAKRIGSQIEVSEEWNTARIVVMKRLVRYKFQQHPDLAELLIATGDAYLEETNPWGDTFWGVCNGKGKNVLGKILMSIREELKNA